MKPTRNRTFCNGCGKTKMLFDSQSKADNFIKFNSDTILEETGKAPVRSYYCNYCGGYHVTSNPSSEVGEKKDNRDLRVMDEVVMFYNNRKDFKKRINLLDQEIAHARKHIINWKSEEGKKQLEKCMREVEQLKKMYPVNMDRILYSQHKIEIIQDIINNWDVISRMTDEEIENKVNPEPLTLKETIIKQIFETKKNKIYGKE